MLISATRKSREPAGGYEQPLKRTKPVAILEEQAKTRLPELIPLRYASMLASTFAFHRRLFIQLVLT